MKPVTRIAALAFAALTAIAPIAARAAEETVKVAAGQRGNWDTSVVQLGQQAGIFKKHGLVLDILWTQGGGETQQAVISGSVDIGIATGIVGVMGAFSKGAPVRILSAETTGAGDLYWYVLSTSPIKSLSDAAGKTMAFSTKGSSTDGVVRALMAQDNLKVVPTATGGPAPTLTQVLSNQIDIGWSAPPFGLQQLDEGKIRIVASGNDSKVFKGQTVRVNATNLQTLQNRRDMLNRFMKAYRETVEWMYSDDPNVMKMYAEFAGVSLAAAKRTRDQFFPKSAIDPDKIVGLDTIVKDAVELKYTATQLTPEQLAQLIQIPPR